jgi:hypothetical protein
MSEKRSWKESDSQKSACRSWVLVKCVLGVLQIISTMRRNDGGQRFYFEVLLKHYIQRDKCWLCKHLQHYYLWS